ncbi:MAG TPA: biopolymer transporter ExbD [Kiritimatiellia bacterium]|nr:biopolymer transporter ExbD [Kiritimatiellia bacterium]
MKTRARNRAGDVGEIPMTPMIDVVFLLLIFFVLSVKPADLLAHQDVSRPHLTGGTATPTLTLDVFPGGYALNGRAVDQAELAHLLKKLGAISTDQPVRVISSPDATHAQLVSAIDTCAAAGLEKIVLLSSR